MIFSVYLSKYGTPKLHYLISLLHTWFSPLARLEFILDDKAVIALRELVDIKVLVVGKKRKKQNMSFLNLNNLIKTDHM